MIHPDLGLVTSLKREVPPVSARTLLGAGTSPRHGQTVTVHPKRLGKLPATQADEVV